MANKASPRCREDEFVERAASPERSANDKALMQEGEGDTESSHGVEAILDKFRNRRINLDERDCPSFVLQLRNEEGQLNEENGEGSNGSFLKRRTYHKFSADERWHIGMLASEVGTTKAMRQLGLLYPGLRLAESTVRSFKNTYMMRITEDKKKILEQKAEKRVRGKYQTYNDKDRAIIGKYAHTNGNANAIRYFKDSYPGLSESTVRGFKNMYTKELQKVTDEVAEEAYSKEDSTRLKASVVGTVDDTQVEESGTCDNGVSEEPGTKVSPVDIDSLPKRKRGRPGKIPPKIEAVIRSYLGAIAGKDSQLLTYKAVIAITKGVLMLEDR